MKFARLTIAVLLLASPLFAWQVRQMGPAGGVGAGEGGIGRFDALKEYLKLTPQQITELREVQSSMRDAVRPLVQDLVPQVKALRTALRQDPVDSAAVTRLRQEIESARTTIRAKRDEFGAKARGVLTPDQVSSLGALEQALKLQAEARQAAQVGLIESPQGAQRGLWRRFRSR